MARQADITLATADHLQLDLDDPGYGFELGPADGIGSQDFELDLGLDFGDGPSNNRGRDEDDSMSIELGRDAPARRELGDSFASAILGDKDKDLDALSAKSRDASDFGLGTGGMDQDFGGDMVMDVDLGPNFGNEPPVGREKNPDKGRLSRACA